MICLHQPPLRGPGGPPAWAWWQGGFSSCSPGAPRVSPWYNPKNIPVSLASLLHGVKKKKAQQEKLSKTYHLGNSLLRFQYWWNFNQKWDSRKCVTESLKSLTGAVGADLLWSLCSVCRINLKSLETQLWHKKTDRREMPDPGAIIISVATSGPVLFLALGWISAHLCEMSPHQKQVKKPQQSRGSPEADPHPRW